MEIVEYVDQQEWESMNQRRVQHYGYDFIYGANTINVSEPSKKVIPEVLRPMQERVSSLFKEKQKAVDQLTINEYEPGMGIPPHFDVHPPFMEHFVSVSLLSGLVMTFKSYKGDEEHVYLPPRSCALFSGEVRFAWFHSIASRKMDRVEDQMHFRRRRLSLTFRTIRQDLKCECDYPFFCESQGFDPLKMRVHNPLLEEYMKKHHKVVQDKEKGSKKVPQKSEEEWKMMHDVEKLQITKPTEIEQKYVYEIYDKIAPHFSHTRYKPWPKIEKFLTDLELGSLVADVGCGNGKYLGVSRERI